MFLNENVFRVNGPVVHPEMNILFSHSCHFNPLWNYILFEKKQQDILKYVLLLKEIESKTALTFNEKKALQKFCFDAQWKKIGK